MSDIKCFKAKKFNRLIISFGVIFFLFIFLGCGKNSEPVFKADFSYVYEDDNHVRFKNESQGEY
jgi:hypothetical protein